MTESKQKQIKRAIKQTPYPSERSFDLTQYKRDGSTDWVYFLPLTLCSSVCEYGRVPI